MGTTTRGFHWPDPTAKLGDTDLAIKSLAEDVDANGLIKKGTDTVDIITVNVVASTAVLFATAYPVGVTPVVVLTAVTGNPDSRRVTVTGVSRTGFTLNGFNSASNADITVAWLAVG